MKPTTRFLLNSITIGCAAALLASCASTQSTTQNKESMLVASGFKVITPKTAAQKQKLQNLPAGTVTMVKKGKKKFSSFPIQLTIRRMLAAPESIRLINSFAPTRSSPGKTFRTPRCIRTRRWNGAPGKAAKECGDLWEGRSRQAFKIRATECR